MNVDILIQSRFNSTRLPGKALSFIDNKPILQWVIEATKRVSNARKVILCTSINSENDSLHELGRKLEIEVFRGSENDVLKRFVDAGEYFESKQVVRVCADNPLINTQEIEKLIEHHISYGNTYTFNHVPKLNNNYPDGLGAEIISFDFLQGFDKYLLPTDPHREHVTSLIWTKEYTNLVSTLIASAEISYPNIKLDIDTHEDFHRIKSLVDEIRKKKLSPLVARDVCSVYLELYGDS